MSQHFTSSSLRKETGAPICQDVKHLEVIAWKAPATEERYCWESLSGVDAASVISVSPSLSLPVTTAESGQCVRRSPHLQSAGGFPSAPGAVALGSAPPFRTQARYCEVSLARAAAESRVSAGEASWLPLCGTGRRRSPPAWGRAGGESTSCLKTMYY